MLRIVKDEGDLFPIEMLGGMGLRGVSWWKAYREGECGAFPGSVRVMVRMMQDAGTGTYWFGLFTIDGETGEVLKVRAMHQAVAGYGPFDPDVVGRMMESLMGMVGDDGVEYYA